MPGGWLSRSRLRSAVRRATGRFRRGLEQIGLDTIFGFVFSLAIATLVATGVNLALLLSAGLAKNLWTLYAINSLAMNTIAALVLAPVFVFVEARGNWTSLGVFATLGLTAGCFASFWLWLYQDLGWRLIGSGYEPIFLADIVSIIVLSITFWRLKTWL